MAFTEYPLGGLGSAVTPEQWATYVLEHLSAQSVVLASGATRIDTLSRVVHVPIVLTDGTADWFAELDPINVGDPTGDELVLQPKKVAALTQLSDEVASDSSPRSWRRSPPIRSLTTLGWPPAAGDSLPLGCPGSSSAWPQAMRPPTRAGRENPRTRRAV